MRKQIRKSVLNEYYPKIPTELEGKVDGLMDRAKVEFKSIDYDNLEALAFRDDWESWDALEIFHNPLISYKNDFIALNPKKQGKFSQTFLFTLQGIKIYRHPREVSEVPSFLERLKGIRTKRSTINEYFCEYGGKSKREVSEDDLIIPIFAKNIAYTKIMDFVNKVRKGKYL